MLKYGKNIIFDPKKLEPLNIDRQSVELIPNESLVLDIGCATGFMGEYLIKYKKCKVTGIDIGTEEIKEARKKLTNVIQGDIEYKETIEKVKEKYDIIFASAVIEHLKDPWNALRVWKKFLKKNGSLVITTSNITHWSTRFKIMRGKFEYKEYGILDNTHLHFFTLHTFKKLIANSGYTIEYSSIDPVGGGHPRISKFFSKIFPNLFAYQMLIKAKRK